MAFLHANWNYIYRFNSGTWTINRLGGVDLFFVLSGYLIGGLDLKRCQRQGNLRLKHLIRRAFKIWPVLYLYIEILVISGRYQPMEIVPQTLLHLQNFWTTPLNHLWSLGVEVHFLSNLCIIGCYYTTCQRKYEKNVLSTLIIIIIAAPILRIAFAWMGLSLHDIQIQTQFRVDALAFGVLLAYINVFNKTLFTTLINQKLILFGCIFIGTSAIVIIKDKQELYFCNHWLFNHNVDVWMFFATDQRQKTVRQSKYSPDNFCLDRQRLTQYMYFNLL